MSRSRVPRATPCTAIAPAPTMANAMSRAWSTAATSRSRSADQLLDAARGPATGLSALVKDPFGRGRIERWILGQPEALEVARPQGQRERDTIGDRQGEHRSMILGAEAIGDAAHAADYSLAAVFQSAFEADEETVELGVLDRAQARRWGARGRRT
jgi:hypothetical protein